MTNLPPYTGAIAEVLKPAENIEGVKPIVAEKIYEIIKNKDRRYFGSSGASLTQQAYNPDLRQEGLDPKMAEIGLQGERDTTKFLRHWIKDKPSAVLIDSVHIRGWGKEEVDPETGIIEGGDTDHVLIIGNEVLLIDTKRWKGGRDADRMMWYQVSEEGYVTRNKRPFPGCNVQAGRARYMWSDFLHDRDENGNRTVVSALIYLNSDFARVIRGPAWYKVPYRLLEKEQDRFEKFLNEKYEKMTEYDKSHINSTLVSQAVVNAVKPYDPFERVFDKKAFAQFKADEAKVMEHNR